MNKMQRFLNKHSSTILTVVGATGVVVTSVLTAKATVKAIHIIEEERRYREESGNIFADNVSYEVALIPDLTKSEIIKMTWKAYIPALISGFSTITCIFGANYLSVKHQTSLMSAYAFLDNSYKEYRKKVEELYGEGSDVNTIKEIVKTHINDIELHGDKELFFDYQSMRWFESTMEEVQTAENIIRERLIKNGYACLNDYYELLHLPSVPHGDELFWTRTELYQYSDIDFVYERGELDDGLEYCIITMPYEPTLYPLF